MKRRLKGLVIHNLMELRNVLVETWNSIPQRTIDLLCASFRYRLCLVTCHDGEQIGPFIRPCHSEEQLVLPDMRDVRRLDDLVLDIVPPGRDYVFLLNPVTGPFSQEEDRTLARLYLKLGNKWGMIARQMNRNPNELKNRWKTVVSKQCIFAPVRQFE